MINNRTPSDKLMEELFSDEGKAIFWLKKHYHGEKGYERMRDNLLIESNRTMKTKISEVVEYISPNGNRWMAFEWCKYYKKAGHANTMPIAFCYYETYGSVGAYMVSRNVYDAQGKNKLVLHFTNHFFLRFCQRLGVEMRSRWMVQRFVEVIPGFITNFNGRDEKGHVKVDIRLPGSIGRGIMYDDSPIIEIRTYLTDKELNNKQLRETEKLRQVYEQEDFEPYDVRMGRIARSDNYAEDICSEIENVAEATSIDSSLLGYEMSFRVMIAESIVELGYVDTMDIARMKDIGERTKYMDFLGFVEKYTERDSMENARQLYELIREFGKKANIKGYDAAKVMDKVLRRWDEILKQMNDGEDD